jgi:ASC-1-like (ASCH) protein
MYVIMIYEKHLSEPWFELILNGLKTVEGRLNKGSFCKMIPGDQLLFYNDQGENFKVIITDIKHYKGFRQLLKKETLKKTLPGVKKIDDGVGIYRDFYSEKDEEKYGVLAIRFRLC